MIPSQAMLREMNLITHANTCCAGLNWQVLWLTGKICEVQPYLPMYEAMNEIPVAGCCTVWMSPCTGNEYLLVGGQFLYFGMMLPHSLLNPNQIQAYDIEVNDNPFDEMDPIGMDCDDIYMCLSILRGPWYTFSQEY